MKYILRSYVFDEAIPSKLVFDNNDFIAGKFYNLQVVFNVQWLSDPKFQLDNPCTRDTLDRDYINEILNSKLDSIEQFFASHGIKIMRAAIIGDKLKSTEMMIIEISEMPAAIIPTESGRDNTPLKVRSIIPSRPFIFEAAVNALAPIIFKAIVEKRNQTGNM